MSVSLSNIGMGVGLGLCAIGAVERLRGNGGELVKKGVSLGAISFITPFALSAVQSIGSGIVSMAPSVLSGGVSLTSGTLSYGWAALKGVGSGAVTAAPYGLAAMKLIGRAGAATAGFGFSLSKLIASTGLHVGNGAIKSSGMTGVYVLSTATAYYGVKAYSSADKVQTAIAFASGALTAAAIYGRFA